MRLHYLVSIAIVIFIAATLEAFSTVSTVRVSAHTLRATDSPTLRSPRTRNGGDSDDEERAKGGISIPITEKLAAVFKSSKVTDEQLQKWLDIGTSADIVFYRMKLNKARSWIFSYPQFKNWVQYADNLSGTAAISTLTAQFGDDELYHILHMAKIYSTSKELASRLQIDQVKHWVRVGKDPDEVFKLYSLNSAGRGLLRSSQFSAWTKYVDDLNAKHEGAISIIPTLRKYYSDADLFKMAEAAKNVYDFKSMGLKLEDSLVQFWINDKQTPVKVLKELQLGVTVETLKSPLLGLLAKFTDAYNVQFQKKTTMIETFTHIFGDEKVAKLLTTVETNDRKVVQIVTEMKAAQLEMWLSSGKSVDDVYNLLNLPHKGFLYDLRENSLFPTWIAYMGAFSIENPDKVTQLLSTLVTQLKDRPMMQILQAAEKFPSINSVAVTLQLQKAENFFATGISPYDAFTAVALDTAGDAVLTSPLFTKWMNYVEDFNKKNRGNEESWFLPIRGNYNNVNRLIETARKNPKGAKIADMVEKAQMEEWLTLQSPPKHVFHFLKLNNEREILFSNPNFELWVKYLNDFNKKYPGKKTTMIDSIRENIIDLQLIQILNEAEKVPTTKKLAENLGNALIDKWVDEKKTVAYMKRWIGHVPPSNVWVERYTKKLNELS
ncbi:hypothetical protein P3T76_002532 [Phytophthora citrophthora]|uniref:RxLR effector PexRD54 WY domain-containing protein n=1 Tax=Phytophthora citrophthora TaxID=4793 RepID=A0AAD9GVT3_9STRA|nr:hypothetical protein P3T76_002532 [Phytophthora citrophthora]